MLPLYPKADNAIPVYIGAQSGDVKKSRLRRFFRGGHKNIAKSEYEAREFSTSTR